jgi:hypothetical protein
VVFEKGDDIFSDPRELFKDMFGGEKFKEFFGEVSFGTELPPAFTPQASFFRGTAQHTLIPLLQSTSRPPRTLVSRRRTESSLFEHSFSRSLSSTWRAAKRVCFLQVSAL